jgi:uncharacterized protein (TIGR02466 family)
MPNTDAHIFNLFPTPLYVATYEGDTTEMIKYFDSCEMNPASGGGYGMISKNSYIVDNPICKEFTEFAMFHFRRFATEIMRYNYEELQFAQSWLTYKEPGQFHKAHTHPNTLLAGVFYYDFQPDDAAICFSKDVKSFGRSYLEPSLLPDYQDHPFSQEEIYFQPKQNNFIIFPSHVMHGVPPNKTNKVRKALGVNALTKGKLGDKETISEIIFGRYAQ